MATGCHANNFQVRSTKATTKNLRSLIGPRNKPVTNGKIGALLPAGHQKQIRSRGNKFATNHQWGRPFCFRPIQGQQICDQSGAVVHQFEVGSAILFSADTGATNLRPIRGRRSSIRGGAGHFVFGRNTKQKSPKKREKEEDDSSPSNLLFRFLCFRLPSDNFSPFLSFE